MLVVSVLLLLAASHCQAQDCSCNDYINKNGYGQCKKEDICYVNKPSNCNDLRKSGTDPGMLYSAGEACKGKSDSSLKKCSSTDGCSLGKNTLLTVLPQLKKEFNIAFEFQAREYMSGWQSVIHLTEEGNCCKVGQRIPALWVKNSGQLHPCFAVNGNGNYNTMTKKYSVKEWHSVQFSQSLNNGKYIYRVVIDGETVLGPVENKQPESFSNVKVYAADPWHNSLKGSIRNLIINTDSSSGRKGYVSLGCWKDTWTRAIVTLEGTDSRLTGHYKARKNAVEVCFEVAKSKGYPAFAVQDGGWCAGSSTALETYKKYGAATNCVDGKGGGWANDVYKIKGYVSLGCWKDTWTRAIVTLEGTDRRLTGNYKERKNAVELCFEVAKSKGYPAFAVQNGGWCAGSSTALETYKKYGAASNCVDGKGGGWANDVYKIYKIKGECKYTDVYPDKCPGWKTGYCTKGSHVAWMAKFCAKTCKC